MRGTSRRSPVPHFKQLLDKTQSSGQSCREQWMRSVGLRPGGQRDRLLVPVDSLCFVYRYCLPFIELLFAVLAQAAVAKYADWVT